MGSTIVKPIAAKNFNPIKLLKNLLKLLYIASPMVVYVIYL